MTMAESLIGRQIGQYVIQSYLAQGGMADVFLAVDPNLDRQVALKILLPEFTRDQEFVARFKSEAKTAAHLLHPNIVQIFATDVTPDNYHYIAMEYIGGGTLDDKLRQLAAEGQLFTTAYSLALVRQVADALKVAHQAGIIHRDLKPSNILLRDDGRAVLADLGIAMVTNNPRLTRTNTLMGTPDYMSPEQAQADPLDGRSDIYSLGIILYELLAGSRPFMADSPWTVLHKQISSEPPPLKQVRPGLNVLTYRTVENCLRKDRNARYQSAEQLVVALDAALLAEGGGASVTDSGVWSWRPQHTGRFLTNRARAVSVAPSHPKQNNWQLGFSLGLMTLPLLGLGLLLLLFGVWRIFFNNPAQEIAFTATSPALIATTVNSSEATRPTSPTQPTSTLAPTSVADEQTAPTTMEGGTVEEEAVISLFLPGRDANARLDETVTFQWRGSAPLEEGQQFALYLGQGTNELLAGTVKQKATGDIFRLSIALEEIVKSPGEYRWWVVLEDNDTGEHLGRSEERPLRLIITNTATPTHTPTATATATPRMTATVTPTRLPTVAPATPTAVPPTLPPPPTEPLDSDGDGVIDANDACPGQSGPPENNGCPLPTTEPTPTFPPEPPVEPTPTFPPG